MMKRREFVRNAVLGISLPLVTSPWSLLKRKGTKKITILHTNDVHSRIDPFPLNHSRFPGMGGAEARALLIDNIRKEEDNVLLLDCGDILQGTPYFNFFEGELEFELMDKMSYDASTIGNHDFDLGAKQLAKLLDQSDFRMLNCNYKLENSPLEGLVKPFEIIEKAGIRIGIIGVGIKLQGLVPPEMYGEIEYESPIQAVNRTAKMLKQEKGCDIVVVLSHLGLSYKTDKPSDVVMAKNTQDVDIILGGHTHSFLEEPIVEKNLLGKPVIVNQVGWSGLVLGRIDLYVDKKSSGLDFDSKIDWIKPL